MWPMGTQLEFTITTLVIGLPRQVVVQRCRRADVDLVLRGRRGGVAAASRVVMADSASDPCISRPGSCGRGGWCIAIVSGSVVSLGQMWTSLARG